MKISQVEFIDDIPQEIKDMINDARERGVWSNYYLAGYDIPTLEQSLKYLEDNDMYVSLQREIRIEIAAKLNGKTEHTDVRGNTWFPIYWNAVLSLFGKGPMNKNDPVTKDILDKIQLSWVNNCKGREI